jgi:hypothetical protein
MIGFQQPAAQFFVAPSPMRVTAHEDSGRGGFCVNKRMMDIIKEFSKQNDDYTLIKLANRYSVSKRTIRNDIDAINDLLDEHKIDLISYSTDGRVVIRSCLQCWCKHVFPVGLST